MSNERILEPAVIYEDADIAAVAKPAGLVVHADGRTKEPTLADWVVARWPSAAEVGEPITQANGEIIHRPGIVHRLDRDTSGIILVAKTAAGHAHLKAQFQAHTIEKKYLAFVHGFFEDAYGIIDRPIGRSASDFRKKSAGRGAEGELRPAMTWYVVKGTAKVPRDAAKPAGETLPISFIEAEPKTGRTHQIRVHMQFVHHPVVCDPLYGAGLPAGRQGKPCVLGFGRTALHARSIQWDSLDGKRMKAEAPVPEDFERALHHYFKDIRL